MESVAWWLLNMIFEHWRIKYKGEVFLSDLFYSLRGIPEDCATWLHVLPHCDIGWNTWRLEECLCLTLSRDSVLDLSLTCQVFHWLDWGLKSLNDQKWCQIRCICSTFEWKKDFFQFKITHELDSSFGLGLIVRFFSFYSEYWHIKTFKDFEIQSGAQARARIGAVRYLNRGLAHAKTFGRHVKVRVKPTGNSTLVYTISK